MKLIVIVGIGSFIGGIFRYLLSLFIQNKISPGFPYATLAVNLLGCLVIGLVFSFSERPGLSYDWKLFLATGICGGFTTFSAFSVESFSLLRNGHYSSAVIYILASVILGIMFTIIGYLIQRLF